MIGSGTPTGATFPAEDGCRSTGHADGAERAAPVAVSQTVRAHEAAVFLTTKVARFPRAWSETTEPGSVSILVPATPGWQT